MAPIAAAAARETLNFTSLPTELRLIIWRETFEPRVLHLTSKMIMLPGPVSQPVSHPNPRAPNHVRFKAREPPPVALQVCRESRALALKHYIPSFHSTTIPTHRARDMPSTAVYFCPQLDTVHIADELGREFHDHIHRTDRESLLRIKALAVSGRFFEVLDVAAPFIMLWFRNVETLILVIEGVGKEEAELIRAHAEGLLVKEQQNDWLMLLGNTEGWKAPAVKVMSPQTFENHL